MSEESWDEALRNELRAVIAEEGNVAAAGRRLSMDENVLRRFEGGKGISAPNLQRLRRGLRPTEVKESAPAPAHHDYWLGVLYAAEAMSETVTRLIREGRQASAAKNEEAIRDSVRQHAAAVQKKVKEA